MDLRERSRAQRFRLELREQFAYRCTESSLDTLPRLVYRKRRDAVLKFRQFIGQVRGEQVAASGQCLPEFDEDGTERFQCQPQTFRPRTGLAAHEPSPW